MGSNECSSSPDDAFKIFLDGAGGNSKKKKISNDDYFIWVSSFQRLTAWKDYLLLPNMYIHLTDKAYFQLIWKVFYFLRSIIHYGICDALAKAKGKADQSFSESEEDI